MSMRRGPPLWITPSCPGTPFDGRQDVAPRLRAVPQIDRFDSEEQRSVVRPLDECLGANTPSLGNVGLGVGALTLTDRQQSGDDGDNQQDGQSCEQPLEPAIGPAVTADLVVGVTSTAVEEIALGRRQIRTGLSPPLQCLGEPHAAVQLTVGPSHLVPRLGSSDEVTEDASSFDVVVEPTAQPRPGPDQRFMGEFDGVAVTGHQPSGDELLDQLRSVGVGGQVAPGHPDTDRITVGARCDQAEQHVLEQRPPFRLEAFVHPLGGLGDSAADATTGPVTVHRQRAALAALPGLTKGMRQQRQGARLAFDFTDEELDQSPFEQQARLAGGPFDRRPQVLLAHRPEEIQPAFDDPGERG